MLYCNEDKEECEGCHLRDICNLDPSYMDPETNETIECPCSICLVKITCNFSLPCEIYRRYNKTMHGMNKGNNYVP